MSLVRRFNAGPNGDGTAGIEGIFTIDSQKQKDMGIVVYVGEVMNEELISSQYHAAGTNYLYVPRTSGNNSCIGGVGGILGPGFALACIASMNASQLGAWE